MGAILLPLVCLWLYYRPTQAELELYKDGQIVDIKDWLATAMPGIFDISVLEATEVIRIYEESVSEWEGC